LLDGQGYYALERWEISLAFSLDDFIRVSNDSVSLNTATIAFADPDYPSLPHLEFARKEVESIAFTTPQTQLFEGDAFTIRMVDEALTTGSVIHLACHSEGDADSPLEHALLMTPVADDSGKLSVRQIYERQTQAELIFLSACGREEADLETGDFRSVAHAFQTAGAGGVISSLWKVDDLSAGVLAKRFYRYLTEGDTKSQAMRRAKQFVREEINPHPSYWSAFQLYGNRSGLKRFKQKNL
jgi:CHAT domain-containing protein